MLFTIVTPSFNQGRFIRDCIESVRAQDDAECEHWVIDAGSTDETVPILKGYAHLHWVSEPDKGQTDAINKGFRRAKGGLLMWLNADDYLLPGALPKVRDFAGGHPEADVIYGDCLFVDEQKRVLRRKTEFPFDFRMLLFYGCFIPSTATFYRRSIIDAGHLLDDSYKVTMDFEYYVRLARSGFHFAYFPKSLACFRWHESNISARWLETRREERLRVQRAQLATEGRAWLAGERTLRALFRAYQVKRSVLRMMRRGAEA